MLDLIECGLTAVKEDKLADAKFYFQQAVQRNPKQVAGHVNLGSVLWCMKDRAGATEAFLKAIAIHPRCADAHINLGVIYGEDVMSDRLDDAVHHLRLAISIEPSAVGYSNLGGVYRRQNKRQLALRAFEAAIAFDSSDWQSHLNCANEYLLLGRYEEGWREYVYCRSTSDGRLTKPQTTRTAHALELGLLPGDGFYEIAVNGRLWSGEHVHHLVIHYEQGFGDTIQSCRYIEGASEKCDRLTFIPQPGLVELMQSSFAHNPKITVTATTPDEFDAYQWVDTLMASAGAAPIPKTPYLSIPPTNKWRHLRSLPGLRVGLVWAGREDAAFDGRRSMHVSDLNPLLDVKGVSFVSLQLHRDEHDPRLYDVAPYLHLWSDTAGVMRELDLIISVDTAAVHLAGAMDKPVWLLNRLDTCWRWQLDRSDSPWYASLRIFRQSSAGDWASVIAEVKTALIDLVDNQQQK